MKIDILLGLQWGDEGKGKIVDVLTPDYDIIARFQGGPNAGHTLEIEGSRHVLHTIPSGIFHPDKINIIGNGVIIDPLILRNEVDKLTEKHVDARLNMRISNRAHLILPTHRLLDAASEKSKGESKIGSTLKGIGPCYTDKTARNGVRVGDILSPDFKEKCTALMNQHIRTIIALGHDPDEFLIDGLSLNDYRSKWFEAAELMKEFQFIDSEYFINESLDKGLRVLAEGAQGSLLDVDFGSYPYVTSSSTIAAGVCSGLGVAPGRIGKVFGVFKAYCTRVGSGPFPTELFDKTGEQLRQQGREFGSTTGRPRRCGWLDMPTLKYTIMLNGVTHLAMMKADVMDNIEQIKICTRYSVEGSLTEKVTFESVSSHIEPLYETLPGWNSGLRHHAAIEQLPKHFKDYIKYIEDHVNIPITIISLGPGREHTLLRQ
ncbi:MAG: adenylosuccinate synthase [Bacteroidota bacterium]